MPSIFCILYPCDPSPLLVAIASLCTCCINLWAFEPVVSLFRIFQYPVWSGLLMVGVRARVRAGARECTIFSGLTDVVSTRPVGFYTPPSDSTIYGDTLLCATFFNWSTKLAAIAVHTSCYASRWFMEDRWMRRDARVSVTPCTAKKGRV